jgi:hypothetical protein
MKAILLGEPEILREIAIPINYKEKFNQIYFTTASLKTLIVSEEHWKVRAHNFPILVHFGLAFGLKGI